MSNNGQLTPKLRFPEFRKEPAWNTVPLDELAERVTAKNQDGGTTRVLTNSAEFGVLDQRDYFEKDIANASNIDGYYVVERGDFVYNPRISVVAPVGPISRNNIGKGVMSPLYSVFRFASGNTDFYEHYFRSACWHGYLRHVSSMGARHDRMGITTGDFMAMPVPTPPFPEQQKIAACLSSLDELLAAEGHKLESLRAYKRSLVQQLFPHNGERVPRLRFMEFRGKAEWTQRKFGDFVIKSFYGTSASTSETGQYPVLRMGNMVDGTLDFANLAYIDLERDEFEGFRLKRGDILLNRTNSRDLVGKVAVFDCDTECITASYIVSFRLDSERIDPLFCNQMLNTQMYQSRIKLLATPSISQANINPTSFRTALNIVIPELDEQQRIAAFLYSLDGQLVVQSEKLATLRKHKRGLMQQLFPSEEAK